MSKYSNDLKNTYSYWRGLSPKGKIVLSSAVVLLLLFSTKTKRIETDWISLN